MAKKVAGSLKLQVQAGQANPSPPIGPALGQRGINIMEFCKAFNAKTQDMEPGAPIPTRDHLLRRQVVHLRDPDAAGLVLPEEGGGAEAGGQAQPAEGSVKPGREVAGSVTVAQVREIAEAKMKDLNANSVEAAMQIILGSAQVDGHRGEGVSHGCRSVNA